MWAQVINPRCPITETLFQIQSTDPQYPILKPQSSISDLRRFPIH